MKNCYKNIKTYVRILKPQFSLLFFDVFESSLDVSCDDKLCPFLPSLTLTLNLTLPPSLTHSPSLWLDQMTANSFLTLFDDETEHMSSKLLYGHKW